MLMLLKAVDATTRGILLADKVASHVPFYGCAKGMVLDSLLGSKEDFHYVSRTSAQN